MDKSEPWFVADRAEKQAALLWSELPVLVGYRRPDEPDLNLRIRIDPNKTTSTEFGVEVKGALELGSVLTKSMTVRANLQSKLQKIIAGCSFPVALMVVDVRTLDTYFGWLLAPSWSRSGKAVLEKVEHTHVDQVKGDALLRETDTVRQWYRDHRASAKSAKRA